jgi:hypothetical protein
VEKLLFASPKPPPFVRVALPTHSQIPKTGNQKIKLKKLAGFSSGKKVVQRTTLRTPFTTNAPHKYHHKTAKNLQKPLQKPSSNGQYFFLANIAKSALIFHPPQPMRREGHRHAASEVVLPNSIPQT